MLGYAGCLPASEYRSMIRAWFYLVASAVIWFVDAFLFSYFLRFSAGQTVLMAVFYLLLFGIAARYFIRGLSGLGRSDDDVAAWRLVSIMPMLVVILGSFVSLPILLLVVAAGKLL